MTNKEFYKAVADGAITEEVKAYAQSKVDAELAKSADKMERDRAIIDSLMSHLDKSPKNVYELRDAVIADGAVDGDLTWQKVSMVLRSLKDNGTVEIGQMISDKRVINVYTLA